jgi:hypothetical protein
MVPQKQYIIESFHAVKDLADEDRNLFTRTLESPPDSAAPLPETDKALPES